MPELYKRAGSPYWYCYLRDPREPDGITRKSTKRNSKAEARAAARVLQDEIDEEIRLEIRQLEKSDPDAMRFSEAAEEYLLGSDMSKSTRRGHTSLLAVVLHSVLGDFPITALDHDDLWKFIRARRQEGASDDTIRRAMSFMSAVYKYQIHHGQKLSNPLMTFDRSVLKQSKPRDRHLRVNQFQAVLDSCESDEHRRILIVLVGTGLRTSELLDLKWEQVDLKNKIIIIGQVDDGPTKTYRSRRVALFEEVANTLAAQLQAQKKAKKNDKDPSDDTTSDGCIKPTDYVFPSPVTGERRFDLSYLRRVVKRRTKQKSFTIHALRATFASWLLQRGNDPLRVRDSLGHSTLSTTTRYAHHLADQALSEIRQLGFPLTAQNTAQTVGLSKKPKKNKSNSE